MYNQFLQQVLCLLAIAFVTIFMNEWRRRLNKKRTSPLPPGPKGYPIIGCLRDVIKNKPVFRWVHHIMQEMETEIACFSVGNSYVIPVTSPELACEFLKKHDAIFDSRPKAMSAKLISNGYLSTVFSLHGDQWKKMRRVLVSEMLSSSMHQHLHDKRRAEADELIRYVYDQCQNPQNNGLINVRLITQHYSGNVVKKLLFNKRSFGTSNKDGGPGIEDMEHMDAVFTTLSHVYGFTIADFVPWLEVFDLDGHKKILMGAIGTMMKYQDLEINRRVEMWQQGIRNSEEDILDRLINLKDFAGNSLLTIHEIKAQINDIMLATIDNPANAAEWSLAEMINEPKILEKACEELDRVVGRNRLVQESDLSKLNYIKACARESLRLHPVSPFSLPRVASKDVVVGGYLIPKGSRVLVSRLGLGRNPKAWIEPLKYNPERHLTDKQGMDEVLLVDQELKLLSFSVGRRGCPGIVLGSIMTTMLLARLIQGFHWKASQHGSESIGLVESEIHNLQRKPLVAHATPRLEPQVYLNEIEKLNSI